MKEPRRFRSVLPTMTALCASFAISATTALAADSSASETARPAVGAAPVNVTVPGVSPAQVLNASYQIHPSDVLNVQVFGDTALTQTATVLPDGTINYPLVGRIDVGGKTADQAAATIKNSLLKYVRHPVVTVAISQQGQYNVLVLGNVKQPGKYPVRSDARLTDAIAAAGGLGPTNGNLPPARVSVGDQNGQLVSLQKLFHDGDVSQNIPLREGSVVYVVAPNTIKVEVLGAVDKPGDLDINEGDRLSIAIARAGNSTKSNADLNHIRVTRQGPDGKPVVYEVNLYNALERGDLRYDMVLVKNDVVYVPVSHTGSATGNGVMNLLGRLLWL